MVKHPGSPQHTATSQPTQGLRSQHQPHGGGSLLLYSTSPAPHERLALSLAAQRCGRQPGAPIRVVVVQTPLAQPSPRTLTSLWQHFGTKDIAIQMQDVGLAVRADAYDPEVIGRLRAADLVLLTGGSPERAYRELCDTPALAALAMASQAGAVIAACSAGAVLFGQGMLSNEQQEIRPLPLWGWLAHGLVAPHYGAYDIQAWRQAFPECWVLGIPNDAMALVRPGWHRVESLGTEPLIVIPRGATNPIAIRSGHQWEIEV